MTKTFSLPEFIAFCRSKPEDEPYPSTLTTKCALAQFGFPGVAGSDLSRLGIPEPVYSAAIGERPFTFGALASRLSKLSS